MKFLIWIGGYLLMTLVYVLTYGIFASAGAFILWLEAIVYLSVWIIVSKKLCKNWDIRVVEKEAHSKGLSIRQYIVSIVPPSLIYTCEKLKDNLPALKDNLKKCVEANTIPKRISVVLLEMYKK